MLMMTIMKKLNKENNKNSKMSLEKKQRINSLINISQQTQKIDNL